MTYKTIAVEAINNEIKQLTLNNPQKLNVLSQLFFDEFDEFINSLVDDTKIRVLLIKGNEKVFSAGGDLSEMLNADYQKGHLMCTRAQKSFGALMNLDFPVIAILDGYVFGGGFEMALHCDIRFCTENTNFKLPECDLGLIPGSGGISIFSRIFSSSDVAYYLYSGMQIPVEDAYRKGLVQKILKQDEIYDYSLKYAKEICNKSPESISTIKKVLISNLFENLDDSLKKEALEFSSVLQRSGKTMIKDFFDKKKK